MHVTNPYFACQYGSSHDIASYLSDSFSHVDRTPNGLAIWVVPVVFDRGLTSVKMLLIGSALILIRGPPTPPFRSTRQLGKYPSFPAAYSKSYIRIGDSPVLLQLFNTILAIHKIDHGS
jgi:hypothetical protein